jgi:hypothetical protein
MASNVTSMPGQTPAAVLPPGSAPPGRLRVSGEVLVAAGCGVIATVICLWMIFRPATAEPRVAQYFVCIAVGLYLSLFFYILWPQPDLAAQVQVPWYTQQSMRVTGPIVLFGLSTAMLFHFMPPREQFGAVYELKGNPNPIAFPSDTKLEYEGRRGERLTYHLIPGEQLEWDTLKLVFIQFPPGEDQIKIVFKHYSYEDLPITLSRSDTAIDLSGLKKRGAKED